MPRRSLRQADLDAIADSQRGLITAGQLREIGYPDSTASRRAAGGMWTRVLPGVHLVEGGRPDRNQRTLATLLYAGPGAVVTGTTALDLHGFRSSALPGPDHEDRARPEPVHVLVRHDRRRLSTGFARVERTRRMPEPARVAAFPLAPVARAVADASRRYRSGRDVTALAAESVQRGLTTLDELREELDAGPVQGSRNLRTALQLLATGGHSLPETDLAVVFDRAGISGVILNARLVTGAGAFIAVADAWLDDVGLAIEVDSRAHHSDELGFERTVRRNARYAAAGVPVVTVLPVDLQHRRSTVLRTILEARAQAAMRPRPDVRVEANVVRSAGTSPWPWGA